MKIKSNKDKITLKLVDKDIEITIRYSRNSRLKQRLKILDELKEELYK